MAVFCSLCPAAPIIVPVTAIAKAQRNGTVPTERRRADSATTVSTIVTAVIIAAVAATVSTVVVTAVAAAISTVVVTAVATAISTVVVTPVAAAISTVVVTPVVAAVSADYSANSPAVIGAAITTASSTVISTMISAASAAKATITSSKDTHMIELLYFIWLYYIICGREECVTVAFLSFFHTPDQWSAPQSPETE